MFLVMHFGNLYALYICYGDMSWSEEEWTANLHIFDGPGSIPRDESDPARIDTSGCLIVALFCGTDFFDSFAYTRRLMWMSISRSRQTRSSNTAQRCASPLTQRRSDVRHQFQCPRRQIRSNLYVVSIAVIVACVLRVASCSQCSAAANCPHRKPRVAMTVH